MTIYQKSPRARRGGRILSCKLTESIYVFHHFFVRRAHRRFKLALNACFDRKPTVVARFLQIVEERRVIASISGSGHDASVRIRYVSVYDHVAEFTELGHIFALDRDVVEVGHDLDIVLARSLRGRYRLLGQVEGRRFRLAESLERDGQSECLRRGRYDLRADYGELFVYILYIIALVGRVVSDSARAYDEYFVSEPAGRFDIVVEFFVSFVELNL